MEVVFRRQSTTTRLCDNNSFCDMLGHGQSNKMNMDGRLELEANTHTITLFVSLRTWLVLYCEFAK